MHETNSSILCDDKVTRYWSVFVFFLFLKKKPLLSGSCSSLLTLTEYHSIRCICCLAFFLDLRTFCELSSGHKFFFPFFIFHFYSVAYYCTPIFFTHRPTSPLLSSPSSSSSPLSMYVCENTMKKKVNGT